MGGPSPSGTSTSVRVALRVRPLSAKETLSNCTECISYVPSLPQIVIGPDRSFTYDHVFNPQKVQEDVYDECTKGLVEKFLEGYNATVLAYGQTGSGKTYTMGTGLSTAVMVGGQAVDDHAGIVPRAIHHMFQHLGEHLKPPSSYTITVSFLELYNEDLLDLLNPSPQPIKIREDNNGHIVWTGVREERCDSPQMLMDLLQRGSLGRATGSTDMNMTSSRSHAIFTVTLHQARYIVPTQSKAPNGTADGETMDVDPPSTDTPMQGMTVPNSSEGTFEKYVSKFHFVDLAGSERLKKTNASGDRAKEGIAINSGLLALGNVISALGDESRNATHVPYRDSKLTRLLQDSLGGNSQTVMLACVSPADFNFAETLSTLKYANRARNIKNRVMVNADVAGNTIEVQNLRQVIAGLKMEIQKLQRDGGAVGRQRSSIGSAQRASLQALEQVPPSELDKYHERIASLEDCKREMETSYLNLQAQYQDAEKELVKTMAERDALNAERRQLVKRGILTVDDLAQVKDALKMASPGVRRRAKTTNDVSRHQSGTPPGSPSDGPSLPSPAKDVFTPYLETIQDLRRKNQHMKLEVTHLRKGNKLLTDAFGPPRPTSSRSDMGGTMAMARDRGRFHATLEKAREQNRQEMEWMVDWMRKIKPKVATEKHSHNRSNSTGSDGSRGDEMDADADREFDDLADALIRESEMKVPEWQGLDGECSSDDELDAEKLAVSEFETEPSVQEIVESGSAEGEVYKMLHRIQADIKLKEELIGQLEESQNDYSMMKSTYESKLQNLQSNLAQVQAEREQVMRQLSGQKAGPDRDKLTAEAKVKYERQIKELSSQIKSYQQKIRHNQAEHDRFKEKNTQAIRQMKNAIDTLKQERRHLGKKMKEDAEKQRELATIKERELKRLRKTHKEAREAQRKAERNFHYQKLLAKRKGEEAQTYSQKLKNVVRVLKKSEKDQAIASALGGAASLHRKPNHPNHSGTLSKKSSTVSLGKQSNPTMKVGTVGQAPSAIPISSNYVQGDANSSASLMSTSMNSSGNSTMIGANDTTTSQNGPISTGDVEIRKVWLDKEVEGIVKNQQIAQQMDDIFTKRKQLYEERAELLDERERVVQAEARAAGRPPDHSQPQYMDDRIEVIGSELEFVNMRLKQVQVDATHSTNTDASVNVDHAIQIIQPVLEQPQESSRLFQLMLDDLISLRTQEKTQCVEIRNLENAVSELRQQLITTRNTALQAALSYEKQLYTSKRENLELSPVKVKDWDSAGTELYQNLVGVYGQSMFKRHESSPGHRSGLTSAEIGGVDDFSNRHGGGSPLSDGSTNVAVNGKASSSFWLSMEPSSHRQQGGEAIFKIPDLPRRATKANFGSNSPPGANSAKILGRKGSMNFENAMRGVTSTAGLGANGTGGMVGTNSSKVARPRQMSMDTSSASDSKWLTAGTTSSSGSNSLAPGATKQPTLHHTRSKQDLSKMASMDVFERLSKVHTVASQAKIIANSGGPVGPTARVDQPVFVQMAPNGTSLRITGERNAESFDWASQSAPVTSGNPNDSTSPS